MLDTLIAQADKAKRLMQSEDPHKLLSENQKQIYDLFNDNNELGVKGLEALLGNQIPQATIKQSLARLVKLNLLERIGAGRGSRYKKALK